MNEIKHHQEWLESWTLGMLWQSIEEAEAAGCDYCFREGFKKINQEIKRIGKVALIKYGWEKFPKQSPKRWLNWEKNNKQ